MLYGGAVAQPPHSTIGTYAVNAILWDFGSEVWIIKPSSDAVRWSTYSGPLGWTHGHLYLTDSEADVARHISSNIAVGKIYIYGLGANQKPYIVTAFTAATDPDWQWDPIGVTPGDVLAAIAGHDVATDAHSGIRTAITASIETHNAAVAAHNAIRALISANADRLDAIDVRDIVEIGAYATNATYVRGSANSLVTHPSGLFIYISVTERSENHDPDQFPGYWLKLSEAMAYQVITSGSHRISARTLVINGDNDRVYLCTTTQTTPRSLAYIHQQAQSVGGAFIWLNRGTEVKANPTGTDGDDLTRLAIAGTNYNLSSGISWGFQIDTLLVPELNQDAITDARMVLEDAALTHYLTFLDWTSANLDMISHLPVGAHIGLRQGTTIRILRVEAVWDSTNNRYQVTNVNAGGILEEASGTATELLLTAGVSGGGADTDLQNIDTDLTSEERANVRNRIRAERRDRHAFRLEMRQVGPVAADQADFRDGALYSVFQRHNDSVIAMYQTDEPSDG